MAMSKWWSFTTTMVDIDRDQPGVYELADNLEKVVYIGSSAALKSRLKDHLLSNDSCIKEHAHKYRIDYRNDYRTHERERLQSFRRIHGRLPRCNDLMP